MKISESVFFLVAHLSVSTSFFSGDFDEDYYERYYENQYRRYRCFPDLDLSLCIGTFYSVVPGTDTARETFCVDCRLKLQVYVRVCLREVFAEIYNITLATICEKPSNIACVSTTEQQACLSRYGIMPTLLAGDDSYFCEKCRDKIVKYTLTCVSKTAAEELNNNFDIACGSNSGGVKVGIASLLAALSTSLIIVVKMIM